MGYASDHYPLSITLGLCGGSNGAGCPCNEGECAAPLKCDEKKNYCVYADNDCAGI